MSIQDTDIIRDRTVQLGTAPAMRGPRSGGNDFMSSLSEAVRDNPVSAALIGMGALWLFTGGSTMSLLGGRGRKSILGTAAHGAESLAQGAGGFAHDAARSAGRMGSSIASGISSTVGGLAGSVSDTAGRVGDYVSQGLHGVDAQAEYRNPNFTSPGGSFRSTVSGMTSDVAGSLHDMFDRHPVALGAAGLALGAAIAASLPLTSTERETLGKANEAVRGKLGEAAEQAKDLASAAVEEVNRGTANRPN
ncbi:MAG: hypothetical protein U1E16_13145 [Hyphomicrobiales bacterium]|uniref:hypothetical protein n=1 Tax=Aestuariivirga sp. TaxID=2650926 RepID=UPI0035B1E775